MEAFVDREFVCLPVRNRLRPLDHAILADVIASVVLPALADKRLVNIPFFHDHHPPFKYFLLSQVERRALDAPAPGFSAHSLALRPAIPYFGQIAGNVYIRIPVGVIHVTATFDVLVPKPRHHFITCFVRGIGREEFHSVHRNTSSIFHQPPGADDPPLRVPYSTFRRRVRAVEIVPLTLQSLSDHQRDEIDGARLGIGQVGDFTELLSGDGNSVQLADDLRYRCGAGDGARCGIAAEFGSVFCDHHDVMRGEVHNVHVNHPFD